MYRRKHDYKRKIEMTDIIFPEFNRVHNFEESNFIHNIFHIFKEFLCPLSLKKNHIGIISIYF